MNKIYALLATRGFRGYPPLLRPLFCQPCFCLLASRTSKDNGAIPRLPPRQFPTSGYVRLDSSEKIEEEELPLYVPKDYYPVHIGGVFASRSQVVSKLGYGTSSTAWLC